MPPPAVDCLAAADGSPPTSSARSSRCVLACVVLRLHTADRFLTGGNFSLIIQQVMVVGTLAIGQTLIILTAGIDLSNGAVMAFGSIVMTKLAVDSGLPAAARDRRWARGLRAPSAWSTGCW